MVNDFFESKCDIYRATGNQKSVGYGLPSQVEYTYGELPTISSLECHIYVDSSNSLQQNLPNNDFSERVKVAAPLNADIKMNDKFIDLSTNLSYKVVTPPRKIRKSHLIFYIERLGIEKSL